MLHVRGARKTTFPTNHKEKTNVPVERREVLLVRDGKTNGIFTSEDATNSGQALSHMRANQTHTCPRAKVRRRNWSMRFAEQTLRTIEEHLRQTARGLPGHGDAKWYEIDERRPPSRCAIQADKSAR